MTIQFKSTNLKSAPLPNEDGTFNIETEIVFDELNSKQEIVDTRTDFAVAKNLPMRGKDLIELIGLIDEQSKQFLADKYN